MITGPERTVELASMLIAVDFHDDVIKWKHFPRYWPFVWGIHRSPVISLHKGQWRGALMFSLICAWINAGVNNREARVLRRHRAHYDVIVKWQLHGSNASAITIFAFGRGYRVFIFDTQLMARVRQTILYKCIISWLNINIYQRVYIVSKHLLTQ